MEKLITQAREQAGRIVCDWQFDERGTDNLVERVALALARVRADTTRIALAALEHPPFPAPETVEAGIAWARAAVKSALSEPYTVTGLTVADQEQYEAFKVLTRLGLVRHAGTWITREEADRISKDGP